MEIWRKKKEYLIKKGRHYASGKIWRALLNIFSPRFSKKPLRFRVWFFADCAYDLDPDKEGLQWNKLYGFSYYGLVHRNSARFAWRYRNGKIELAAYVYVKGVRKIEPVGYYDVERWIECEIDRNLINYRFSATNSYKSKDEVQVSHWGEGGGISFRNFPFFGGETPALHDTHIMIDELK